MEMYNQPLLILNFILDTSILVDFFLLINYSCDKRGIQRALFETGKKEDLESVTTQDPHFGLFLLIFHYRFCNNKSILSLILLKVPPALLRVWQLGHGMVNRIRSSVLPYGRILRKMGHRRVRHRCQV